MSWLRACSCARFFHKACAIAQTCMSPSSFSSLALALSAWAWLKLLARLEPCAPGPGKLLPQELTVTLWWLQSLSSSCPMLSEPQAGALPCSGPGALPHFLCPGHRAQALATARFAVFPSAWPFSDLEAHLLGPLPLVRLEKACLLSSPLPGALFQGLQEKLRACSPYFWSHGRPPLCSLFFFFFSGHS